MYEHMKCNVAKESVIFLVGIINTLVNARIFRVYFVVRRSNLRKYDVANIVMMIIISCKFTLHTY